MKNWLTTYRVLAFLGLIGILLPSCGDNEPQLLFQIPFRNVDFEIPPTLSVIQVHYFNIDNVPTDGMALFDANNVAESEATAIFPSRARMQTIFTAEEYDFIEQMSVRICEAGDLSENCGKEIFWRQPVPQNAADFVDLIPSELDVKEFLLLDEVNIQVKLERLRRNPPQFIETRLEMDFDVK